MTEQFRNLSEQIRQELPDLFSRFFKLKSYANNPDLFTQQTEVQKIESPVAEAYYHLAKDRAWDAARNQGDYPSGIAIIQENLDDLKNHGFTSHDRRAIQIFFLRRLGKIYEHWATFGEAGKSLDDEQRQQHFMTAAYYYAQGELSLGVMTEFASRISESLRGAGLHDLANHFDSAFWGNNIEYADQIDVNIIREEGTKVNEEESGGGKLQGWVRKLIPKKNN